jgi:hypothetical protein
MSISAGDGINTLCTHEKTGRSRNYGTGMVAIELQHEKRSDSMFSGIFICCEPQYNLHSCKLQECRVNNLS